MKRIIGIALIICFLCMSLAALSSCTDDDEKNWGNKYDWGKDYYWDNNEHTVKKKANCIARGTLITMADGSQKPIEELKESDFILAFDHVKGEYVHVNPIAVFNHGYDLYPMADLTFSDGSVISIIVGHVFFDIDLLMYVEINTENFRDYIGHSFVKYSGDNDIDSAKLISVNSYDAYNEAWGTWGFSSLACITNGILSLPNADGTYNYFEYDENLKYNEVSMTADLEKYGVFTYEDWSDLIPYEVFEGFNFIYFKVAIGKGLATYETYLEHIRLFNTLSSK